MRWILQSARDGVFGADGNCRDPSLCMAGPATLLAGRSGAQTSRGGRLSVAKAADAAVLDGPMTRSSSRQLAASSLTLLGRTRDGKPMASRSGFEKHSLGTENKAPAGHGLRGGGGGASSAVLGDVTNTTSAGLSSWAAPTSAVQPLPTLSRAASRRSSGAGLAGLAGAAARPSEGGPRDSRPGRWDEVPLPTEGDWHGAEEYLADVDKLLHREQVKFAVKVDYMERQSPVTPKMRGILIDWLVGVHRKYRLKQDTLFLTVDLIDSYLEKRKTAKKFLQLVGVAALLIASKFEDVSPPSVANLVYVTDKTYTEKEVKEMEITILAALEFRILRPTASQFLERYQDLLTFSEAQGSLAQYLLELSLLEYRMVRFLPSHVAAAAALLSSRLLRRRPCWTDSAVEHTGLTELQLADCVGELVQLLERLEGMKLVSVTKKYSQPKYHEVSKLIAIRKPLREDLGRGPPSRDADAVQTRSGCTIVLM